MSPVKPIPAGYHSVQPYLHVRGAAKAIEFYKQVFGAQEVMRMAQPDGRLGHAEIRIGDSVVMLADEFPERGIHGPAHYGGAPMTLMFYTEDCDAIYNKAIAAGSKSMREPPTSSTATAWPASKTPSASSGTLPHTSKTFPKKR
jgi:PhnB protein